MLIKIALVAIGAALGGTFRYLITLLVTGAKGVLLVNAVGSFLLGFASCVIPELPIFRNFSRLSAPQLSLVFCTGFCGAFTTFSTFSKGTFDLIVGGETFFALLNIGVSVILCLLCVATGVALGKVLL